MSYAELEYIDKEFTNMVMKFELNNNGLIQNVINKLRYLDDLLEVTATVYIFFDDLNNDEQKYFTKNFEYCVESLFYMKDSITKISKIYKYLGTRINLKANKIALFAMDHLYEIECNSSKKRKKTIQYKKIINYLQEKVNKLDELISY